MLHSFLWPACIALCAIGFRIRGGVLSNTPYQLPGQVSRLIFAAAAGLTAWTGVSWWLALATAPAWWIASTIPLFGAIGLGTVAGRSKAETDPSHSARWWFWRDFGMLGVRGLLWTVLPSLVLWWPHVTLDPVMAWGQGAAYPWALLIAGPTMPVCYWLARQSGCRLPGLGRGDYCETAEAIYGAVLGFGVLVAVA